MQHTTTTLLQPTITLLQHTTTILLETTQQEKFK